MILLCYDGSSDAQCAIDRAGELLRGQPATILTLWTASPRCWREPERGLVSAR
jgi:hypothetical protein